MKQKRHFLAVLLFGTAAVVAVQGVHAADQSSSAGERRESESAIAGSIRVDKDLKPAELVALAKISFKSAMQAALVAIPGHVIKAELESEDHTLMYSFEIVNADGVVMEAEIDAGDGKVLAIEED